MGLRFAAKRHTPEHAQPERLYQVVEVTPTGRRIPMTWPLSRVEAFREFDEWVAFGGYTPDSGLRVVVQEVAR